MSTKALKKVDYMQAARRHLRDAQLLKSENRLANAGQLFGFSVECGLSALLQNYGVPADKNGSIPYKHPYREHMPKLNTVINTSGILNPGGSTMTKYYAMLPGISNLNNWRVEHRYYREAALPLQISLASWEIAAIEVKNMLDQLTLNGTTI